MTEEVKPVYCPRCDRMKPNIEDLKKHVEKAHPDYDPEWWDTYDGHPSVDAD